MARRLEGKTVLITGASSGLGEQLAYSAAKEGAILILCARREDKLVTITQQCTQLSGKEATYYLMDITDYEMTELVLDRMIRRFTKIDVLINNAGFGLFREFLSFEMETAEKMFQVNVLGLMHLTKKIANHMVTQEQGHIINIGSQGGKIASPKSSVYSATKFAVIGFSNALRLELKPKGVIVTTINPGPIKTNFFDIADETGNYLDSIGKLAIDPSVLSKKIVNLIGKNKRELNTPKIMEVASRMSSLFPKLSDILTVSLFNKK
ncbi:SDR family NAD(P)-dependent oxidoreductase [Vagococcus xieshaowenii]|uniref:SDR family oxidoreductase n=1 Tax=Vagococcus xieshaowenii TaxID=2562451 RepID=A0AAJ5EFL3_9ENTE|nr:SDR family oxidoreductase [Vagococcus xieshaowenii]QCA28677.1 SDR family oxidoreductase [Vagococcus xieshaowenii]TFZ40515.1 SDR family oxidoreductase [Vagococcus xieshaowenii]